VVTSAAAYLALLGLLVLERLAELLLSRRNARRAFARGAVELGQGHYRVMVLVHTAFLVSCAAEVVLLARPFPSPWGWVALAGALLSQALRYWSIFSLGDRWNTRVIVLPREPLIVKGPYRYLRHPNYLAVVVELLCVPLIHGAWLTALLFTAVNGVLLTVRIRSEEQALGPGYAEAFADKPRFLPELHRGPSH
jgi:methyltransferase